MHHAPCTMHHTVRYLRIGPWLAQGCGRCVSCLLCPSLQGTLVGNYFQLLLCDLGACLTRISISLSPRCLLKKHRRTSIPRPVSSSIQSSLPLPRGTHINFQISHIRSPFFKQVHNHLRTPHHSPHDGANAARQAGRGSDAPADCARRRLERLARRRRKGKRELRQGHARQERPCAPRRLQLVLQLRPPSRSRCGRRRHLRHLVGRPRLSGHNVQKGQCNIQLYRCVSRPY